MSLRERYNNIRSRFAGRKELIQEQSRDHEEPREIGVQFHDFTDEDMAEEHGLVAGYYFSVHSVRDSDLQDGRLRDQLILIFLNQLEERGLLGESDTTIPIDKQGQMYVDPGQAWAFHFYKYSEELEILAVRATPADMDDTQRAIVSALR